MLTLTGQLLQKEPRADFNTGEHNGTILHVLSGIEVFKVSAPLKVSADAVTAGDHVQLEVKLGAYSDSQSAAKTWLSALSIEKARSTAKAPAA